MWWRLCWILLAANTSVKKKKMKRRKTTATAKSFHIRYVSMHTWIIDFVIVINGTKCTETSRSKYSFGLCSERVHWKKWEHSFIYSFDVHTWIHGCVNVWTFMNKAWCEAFGCNYKLFFAWYALRIALHSFVPTIFSSLFCFSIFFLSLFIPIHHSTIASNKIGMQCAIHVACCGSGMGCVVLWWYVCALCIVSLFWALVSHSMHLCVCVWVCVYGCDFDSHCKRHNIIFSVVENHIPWHESLLLYG